MPNVRGNTDEPAWVRWTLIAVAVMFMALFLLLPLILVFYCAFEEGLTTYWEALTSRRTLRAIGVTLLTIGIAVPINVLFGIMSAWCLGKFNFWGKSLLISLIDLPFAVSPVIAGLLFVLLFGLNSLLGDWLMDAFGIKILHTTTATVIATMFVTFPFVTRELLPIMQAQGTEEELAARVLGANGLQIFFRVTLPNIKWALLYGVVLCNARAMGEFGAVNVVSHGGKNNTLSLLIYETYQSDLVAAFAVSTLLALMAIITLILKTFIEMRTARKEGIEI
ncbi:MAG: sulfate ABC transporter permease subunit CysW [Planctomycetaceae bacterium]|nr:sulfate ABC transporter permease subunit CysW [Planctomycetaceae bacterium]MBQ2821021.1 sulfate ABC transporter permease subunit CysW [Thermoguttaceae bacterium]MDO4424319.1 sulfate ABC transporter permease subunit CysW [Planctomycetia bacterium]